MLLKGKVGLITGGGKGIGRAIALAFAREGANIVIADIDETGTRKTVKEINSLGSKVKAIKTDVSRKEEVKNMVDKTLEIFGQIDILVNNAAILYEAPFVKIKEEEWDRVINVNLKGTFLCSQMVARHMILRRKGKIINVSSVSAIIPGLSVAAYCSSKAAVLQLTRVLALELAPYKICVNAICPGTTKTEMILETFKDRKEVLERWRKKIPMGDFPRVEDHAALAVFLASPASDHITGQAIFVDCGQMLNFAQP